MTKKIKTFTALALCAALLLAGCNGKGAKEIDIEAVAADMLAGAQLEFDLVRIGDSLVEKYYDLSAVESFVVYYDGSGASTEEISLFVAKSEGDVAAVKEMLSARIDKRYSDYENYVPAEAFKVQNAAVASSGRYVAFIVAPDPAKAESIFDAALKD